MIRRWTYCRRPQHQGVGDRYSNLWVDYAILQMGLIIHAVSESCSVGNLYVALVNLKSRERVGEEPIGLPSLSGVGLILTLAITVAEHGEHMWAHPMTIWVRWSIAGLTRYMLSQ